MTGWTLNWTLGSVQQKFWTLNWTLSSVQEVQVWTLVQNWTSQHYSAHSMDTPLGICGTSQPFPNEEGRALSCFCMPDKHISSQWLNAKLEIGIDYIDIEVTDYTHIVLLVLDRYGYCTAGVSWKSTPLPKWIGCKGPQKSSSLRWVPWIRYAPWSTTLSKCLEGRLVVWVMMFPCGAEQTLQKRWWRVV